MDKSILTGLVSNMQWRNVLAMLSWKGMYFVYESITRSDSIA